MADLQPIITEIQSAINIELLNWPGGKEASICLRFDDSLESHVHTVVPLLYSYNIKGTFLVNPGKKRFRKHLKFWTSELPKQGHHLGNHTMKHRGARDLSKADYEIGEPARLIRESNPGQGRLTVFASGGGEKWGGKFWKKAGIEYRSLVEKHQLVDLHDGHHSHISVMRDQTAADLSMIVENALIENRKLTLTFHQVGKNRLKDIIKGFLFRRNDSFKTEEFEGLLSILHSLRDRLWIAPLIETIKYEREVESAEIIDISVENGSINFRLNVGTNPLIYDIPLTVLIAGRDIAVKNVFQDGEAIPFYRDDDSTVLWLIPATSNISIITKQS